MFQTEKQVLKKLKIGNWGELNWENFLEYLELAPDIPEDLILRIIQAVPGYAVLLNQASAHLHITMGAKRKKLLDRQDKLDHCMKELKVFMKKRDVPEEGVGKMLLLTREVAGVYEACEGSHRTIHLLSKYAIILLLFIFHMSGKGSE